jgi:hypothetical protein
MSKCYPIDRHLQMRRNAKSSCDLRHNSSRDSIEDTICVIFMRSVFMRPAWRPVLRPAGMFMPPGMRPFPGTAATDGQYAFTMNSMARATFRIYTP